jgi:pyruvate,water dikinase
MRAWEPPPALGQAPEMVTDPVLVVHWGITTERVQGWLADAGGARAGKLHGIAGSPGVAEGPARVILRSDGIGELEEGEILVAPSTSTSWTPAFATIAGAVLDVGGAMCHAAIVAREYGLPAVVGTGSATKRIRTGDRIRVDGGTGVVTILT